MTTGLLQQLRHVAGMHRPGPAEGEQRQPAIVDAAVDRVRPRRRRHRFTDRAIDAGGPVLGRRAERFGERELALGRGDRASCRRRENCRHRDTRARDPHRSPSACRRRGRRRRGRGTEPALCGPTLSRPRSLTAAMLPPPAPISITVDRGDENRQAAAGLEAVDAVDLEIADHQRRTVLDDAGLRGGAAHVERQEPVELPKLGIVRGRQRARRRSRLHHAHRIPAGDVDADDAAIAQHDQGIVGEAALLQTAQRSRYGPVIGIV